MQAIIFDFGGVLCFHPSDAKVDILADRCGLSRAQFLETYWANRVPYDRGDFDPAEYWRLFSAKVGRQYTPAQIEEFRRLDVDFWMDFDQPMIDWIRSLRAARIKVGLISNLPYDLGEHLRKEKFYELFDHATLSYEQRCVKPDSPIYLECCHGLGVEPSQALFLDDREPNTQGAIAVGMNALLFESRQKLAADLNGAASQLLPAGAPPLA